MKRVLPLLFIVIGLGFAEKESAQYIERQGNVMFFSYTPVENIQASNNQVLSSLDGETGEIAVRVLMRAFSFKKSLMEEHFNESYIESDLYPEATLQGTINNFDPNQNGTQTRIVKGDITLRGITKPIEVKTEITRQTNGYSIQGEMEIKINDFNIKVPPILSANIAKKIQISFKFQYAPYEN